MNRFASLLAGIAGSVSLLVSTPTLAHSPVGYWKTIDDTTGKAKSIIQIWKANDQTLMGRVVKLFSSNQKEKICLSCPGNLRNQPIVGMVVLSGLKANENQWGNGKILDPENGKHYNCSIKLSEAGKKLNVKGYTGIPLLGRSETWERVDLMSDV